MQVDHIDRVDEPGGAERIAQSLAAYWQSIYRCTHTTDNTDYTKIAADYPDDMRLTAAECEGLGADFTVTEVLAAIKGLSVNKSTHGIVAEVFKGAAAELAPMLCAQLNYARRVGGGGAHASDDDGVPHSMAGRPLGRRLQSCWIGQPFFQPRSLAAAGRSPT